MELVKGIEGTHIVFILDLQLKAVATYDEALLLQSLDSILAFGNSILIQSGANKLTILGSSTVKNDILYADFTLEHGAETKTKFEVTGGQIEKLAKITSTFRTNLSRWLVRCLEAVADEDSVVSTSSMISGALAQALCLLNRHRADYKHSRIAIFSLGGSGSTSDSSSTTTSDHYSCQYMKLINCFFAAQKLDIIIDACSVVLSREAMDSAPVSASMEDRYTASILQQGTDLTGGRYLRVHKADTLLEHLLWVLTPGLEERNRLVLPPKLKICPPAACFCHRKVLDIGYVCSVCVSVFCQFLPYCSTCYSNVFVNNLKKIAVLKTPGTSGDEKSV